MPEEEESDVEESQRGLLGVREDQSLARTWCRDGQAELIVPLAVLSVLGAGVLIYNFLRPQFVACGDESVFAKHFYCHNSSSTSPGFHLDTPAG